MVDAPILICYDNSSDARHAVKAAATLFPDRRAIVLDVRGLTGARELLKGSLSHEVVEHAGRPVLIVPPANVQPRGRRRRT